MWTLWGETDMTDCIVLKQCTASEDLVNASLGEAVKLMTQECCQLHKDKMGKRCVCLTSFNQWALKCCK